MRSLEPSLLAGPGPSPSTHRNGSQRPSMLLRVKFTISFLPPKSTRRRASSPRFQMGSCPSSRLWRGRSRTAPMASGPRVLVLATEAPLSSCSAVYPDKDVHRTRGGGCMGELRSLPLLFLMRALLGLKRVSPSLLCPVCPPGARLDVHFHGLLSSGNDLQLHSSSTFCLCKSHA